VLNDFDLLNIPAIPQYSVVSCDKRTCKQAVGEAKPYDIDTLFIKMDYLKRRFLFCT
jgi:hypothetical protein